MKTRLLLSLVAITLLATAAFQPAVASNLKVVGSFLFPKISVPTSMTAGTDGNFYGTTATGGIYGKGEVVKASPDGAITKLLAFDGTNGDVPNGILLAGPDGNFYGFTTNTVFKVTPAGVLTTLASISANNLIFGKDGNLYGTTLDSIFSLTTGGTMKKLSSYAGTSSLLQGSDGNLYGASVDRIFQLTLAGQFNTLATTGSIGLVQHADGFLYGATTNKLFKLSTTGVMTTLMTATNKTDTDEIFGHFLPGLNGHAFVTLTGRHRIDEETGYSYAKIYYLGDTGYTNTYYTEDYGTWGYDEVSLTGRVGADGIFYGFYGNTVVVVNAPGASGYTPNYYKSPYNPLIVDSQGNLYGASTYDSAFFKLEAPGDIYQKLGFFVTGGPGYAPVGRLLQGKDNNFYGTASAGGAFGDGSVFKMTSAGVLTAVVSFDDATTGTSPVGGLLQGADGNLYGVATTGGAFDQGTIFRVTLAGAITPLVTFDTTNGARPTAPLILGSDGNFYGTTSFGGANGKGTVFRLTPAGAFQTLFSFNGTNGAQPNELLQFTDGNFYGTTYAGGADGFGSVFRLTPAGELTTLISFHVYDINGNHPTSRLIPDGKGNLVGVNTLYSSYSQLFKITPDGVYGPLAQVGNSALAADLVQGSDGNIYGAVIRPDKYGQIFEATPENQVNLNIPLNSDTTGIALGGVIRARNNYIYGVTSQKGPLGGGTVFSLIPLRSQTIDFPDIPDHATTESYFNFPVTATSGLPVYITAYSGPAYVSRFGPTVGVFLYHDAGIVTITAVQQGSDSYSPASPVTKSFKVIDHQILNFPTIPAKYLNADSFYVTASVPSGLPVTLSILSGPATLSGSLLKLTREAGTVTIMASQVGDEVHTPVSATQSFSVFLLPQTISFAQLASPQAVGTVLTLQATASSRLPVTFSATGPATISGNQLTLTGAGKVTVTATQAGNAKYAARSQTQNVAVKQAQTITFPTVGNVPNDTPYTLGATASSGLVVSYTVVSGPATVSGKVLTFTGVGRVTVQATQAGNSSYLAAKPVTVNLTAVAVKSAQTITFPAVSPATVGQTVALKATASSGLTITYRVATGSATISGSNITFTAAGRIQVVASQAGNVSFMAAKDVALNITVK